MGSIVGGITNALFGEGGAGTAGEAVSRARELAPGVRFNPFTVRTGAGSASYTGNGQFSTTLSEPYQNLLSTTLSGANRLFQDASTFDAGQRGAELFRERADLLQPEFEKQAVDLQNRLFGSGRLGLRLAGESQGLGTGSGMVQPDALGLGRQQQQTLAQLATTTRAEALNEQAQLQDLATNLINTGMSINEMERLLLAQGVDSETARATAQLASAQLELEPYGVLSQVQQDQRGQNAQFVGGLASSLFGQGGFFNPSA